jgi:hypothetical protein
LDPRAPDGDAGTGAAGMLSQLARAVFARPPRRQPRAGGFDFFVDGVRLSAAENGPRSVRLSCVVLHELPDKDGDLRALMAQYLRYCDAGTDVLCIDADGQLVLIGDIAAGEDVAARAASFCDAAVHWFRMAARRAEASQPMRGTMMIFP